MAGAICVFSGLEAEVEADGDQVGDVVGYEVRGDSFRGKYGVHDSQGVELFLLVGIVLPHEVPFEPGVCLRVG